MKIAIIGSGNVGGALAQQWIKAGHSIVVGANFPLSDKNKALATKIGEDRFVSVDKAVEVSEVILIATPPVAIIEIVAKLGDVSNKVIIDATNSIGKKPEPYPTVFHCLADKTKGAIVKSFNTTGFENMLNPNYQGKGIDMFMAGDDERAKQVASQLAIDCGFANCYDFGGSDKVLLLEQWALCWINLAIMQGMGRDIALTLVKR